MLLITLILFIIFFLFLLYSYNISGYGDLADKNFSTSNNSQKIIIESVIPEETPKPVKSFAQNNKGKGKGKGKNTTKFQRLKADNHSKVDEYTHKRQTLDLSLPFNIREITNPPGSEGNHYLPDFFSQNKRKTKNPLQVDGKFIKREEKELDKESKVDGIGINFKLRQ